MDFKKALRVAMAIHGMNQGDLSARSGCSLSSISQWINSRKQPKLNNIQRLADAMDMKASELLSLGEQ